MFKRLFVNSPFAFVGIVFEITGAKIPGAKFPGDLTVGIYAKLSVFMQSVVIYANIVFLI